MGIGAVTTLNEILESSGVSKRYSILTETVSHMASTQVENIGTIEGNVCNTVPSAETVPPVIFLGDQMKLIGSRKERMVLAEGFLKDPDRTVTDNFELVRKIQLPPPLSGGREIYLKHTLRGQMDLPIGKVPACMAVWGSATKIWADLTILFIWPII